MPPVTIGDYLRYLDLPRGASLEQNRDTLRAVLEEWQRPYFLVIYLGDEGLNTERQNGLGRYVCKNLSRTRPGGAKWTFAAGRVWEYEGFP